MSLINVTHKIERYIPGAAIFLIAVLLTSCSSTLLKSDRITLTEKKHFKNSLEELFQNKLSQKDFEIASSTYLLLSAFQNIRENNFDSANKISKDILYTEGLSPSVYKFAFKAYSISSVLILNAKYDSYENLRDLDFFAYQSEQCEILCDSFGWKVLANDDSSLFTQKGYDDVILSEDFFSYVNKKKPEWLTESLFPKDQVSITREYISKLVQYEDLNNANSLSESISDFDLTNTDEKEALSLFIKGEFKKSIALFLNLARNVSTSSHRSVFYYWIGRAYSAENNLSEAKKYFLKSGIENPLSLYDSLSGQMIQNSSGRASTKELSPFLESWESEMEKWVSYPDLISKSDIVTTLKSALILASKIKIENQILKIDEFQDYIKKNSNIETLLLKEEVVWLQKNWKIQFQKWPKYDKPEIIGNNISWLLYIIGENIQSIVFVSHIKDTLDPYSDNNNFLYFLFYPRLYKNEVNMAIKQCNVDPDLVYAVLRQEGFYSDSHENQESIMQKTCLLKSCLDNYKDGIVNSLSAYRIGVSTTDVWLKNKAKINDDAVFMENIPDEKVKDFVQETVKNYYNIKWIYYKKSTVGDTLLKLFFAYER